MRNRIYDVIVVGGGMAAAHAARPIVEAGKDVLMLDGGVRPASLAYDTSGKDFESIRKTDEKQYQLFLGEDFGAVLANPDTSHSAAMTSGNRSYVSLHTDTHVPIEMHDVSIYQSLAKGGLSEAWGSVCGVFNKHELDHAGIPHLSMHAHYQAVMDRVGISGIEPGYRTQPPVQITESMRKLFARYQKLSPEKRRGFELQHTLQALITERLGAREPIAYQDLEFYTTRESAIYRARYTIEEMEGRDNFHYLPGHIVQQIRETGDFYEVASNDFSGARSIFHGKRVVLAAGAINSTRIMLQSDSNFAPTDLMLKPTYTTSCVDPRLLGESGERKRHSLCQLTIDFPGPSGESVLCGNVYNYRSLLLWRLLQYSPLPVPEALSLLSRFAPSMVLVDIRFSGNEGLCEIALGEHGLSICQKKQHTTHRQYLPKLRKFLRALGLIPLYTAHPPLGASIHCAGGIRAHQNGEVESHSGLYAADSSGWRGLPAKPVALTIMANADRIGTEVARSL